MIGSQSHRALSQYRQIDAAASAIEADPRKLIEMLLAGALDRLAQARGCVLRDERAGRHYFLSSTISIIEHLRVVLDLEAGGEVAQNLRKLYDYMLNRLPAASVGQDVKPIDEVIGLLRTIKSAWDALPADAARH